MMKRRSATVALPLLLIGFACSGDPTGPLPASLTTDAAHYVAVPGAPLGATREYSFSIVARFTNRSPVTVHLSRCFPDTPYPIHGILNAGGDTTAAYDPGWGCVGGLYLHVAPGETRVDTLPIRAPWGIDGRTGASMGVFDGQYVLVYEMYGCVDETPACSEPIHGNARSNVFTVVR